MDFVERWFGASPDDGSGTFELALLFAVALVTLVSVRRRSKRSRTVALGADPTPLHSATRAGTRRAPA